MVLLKLAFKINPALYNKGGEGVAVAFQCQELRDFLRSDQYEIDHQPLKSNVALMSKVWSSECI